MKKRPVYFAFLAVGLVSAILTSQALSQSDLEPPTNAIVNGMPVSTMKSLNQIEPRTLISQLPFDIVTPGSYYVSMPLFGAPASNGITISASNVRLDLSGFPLVGGSNSFDGIAVALPCDNIAIRNGVLLNWGKFGLNAIMARGVTLADVKAVGNGWGGLYTGGDSLVERCSAYDNGKGDMGYSTPATNPPVTDGLQVGPFSTITECKAGMNQGAGIHTYEHSRIMGCTATESRQANGFWAEDYCTIRDCTAARNNNSGMRVGSMCRVIENTCGQNGTNFLPDQIGGIAVEGNNNLIENNIVSGNSCGIRLLGVGNLVIHNAASKNLGMDYFNVVPPQSNFTGSVSAFTPGNGGAFSNSNPWANFSFR